MTYLRVVRTKEKPMKLTEKEKAVLKAMAFNHYGEGTCTWSWAINESREPSGIEGKELSGVISSLTKKGLFRVDEGETRKEDSIWTTEAGKAAMIEFGWMKKE
jgi:hypothetical protein